MHIPIELIEQIEKGNCVLFLGWHMENGGETKPQGLNELSLAGRLAQRASFPDPISSLYEVAEFFEVQHGRHALVQYVCDVVEEGGLQAPTFYSVITELPFNIIVSTCLDNNLKRTFQAESKKLVTVVRDEEISFIDDDRVLLVKLYGDIDNRASLVLTREDYIAFFEQLPSISDLLKFYFSTKTLLFVGYNLNDPHFLQLYSYANQRTRGYQRRAFAVKPDPSQYDVRLWQKRNLAILDTTPERFFVQLKSGVVSRRLPPKDTISTTAAIQQLGEVHKSPYKFLNSYEERDADIFFGRDDDIVLTIRKILSSKLMILYGKSGYGKTSLLNAGIAPRLIASDYLPVYARCAGDPLATIKSNTIDRVSQVYGEPTGDLSANLQEASKLPLLDFIRKFKSLEERTPIIFIDQFEEFFISLGTTTKKRFEEELAACVNSPYTDSIFVLSLREDFLPELHELKNLHNIFENRYRLHALSAEAATEAITKPAAQFEVSFDDGLVGVIIQELSDRRAVDPAQLQIVCDHLYNSLPEGQKRITYQLYEAQGGVKQILADYVDSILESFGPRQKLAAKRLLRSMVTSWFTRIALSLSDAILETASVPDWDVDETERLLRDLVRVRLIRRVAGIEDETYELAHEYLINKIREWIDLDTLRVKEAQDLLRQEHNNWQRHKIPMSQTAFTVIDAQRGRLILNNNSKAFILTASARYDSEFEYWVRHNQDNELAINLLLWLLREDSPDVQRLAGIGLGILADDAAILDEVYEIYATVANPNTVKRVRHLESKQGFSFAPSFLERVQGVVEHRFTANMTLVQEGSFLMGVPKETVDDLVSTNDIPPAFFEGQYPQREVSLEAFYVDKFPVTNAEFKEFRPSHTYPAGHDKHPATNVSWYEAEQYAEWLGKRLLTEEEWEKAARGEDGRNFPWGDAWDPARCNTRLSGYGGTTDVDKFPSGSSPHGCFDMSGNVWEWTSTWLNDQKKQKILKGGSWSKYGILPWTWYRFNYEVDSGYQNVGFRCARTAESP